MPIDPTNDEQVKDAYQWVDERVQDFYLGNEYGAAWNRFKVRIDAYHRRPTSSAPKWRSQLYFASYFVGTQAIDAQIKAAHSSDPFVFVKPFDNAQRDMRAAELAKMAHFNLNYDLGISKFKSKLFRMFFYVELFGTACAREYIRTEQEMKSTRKQNIDAFGIDQGVIEEEEFTRKEYTSTQVIHPLNHAHDVTRPDFLSSEWGSVRFELPLSELYKMKGHPKYYQKGVNKLIEESEKDGFSGYTVSKQEFYSERGGKEPSNRKHVIVVNEYSGPIRSKGNRQDSTLYYILYSRQTNAVLRIGISPFTTHPYWKVKTHPAPDGPYGIGSQDALLPINEWENFTVNQYNDYMNAALKFMYEVNPEAYTGGLDTLINGLPNGILPLEPDQEVGQNIKSVGLNVNSIPPVRDIIQMIQSAKQEYGASSNLRGEDGGSNADTATGIRTLAEREDTITAALLDDIDEGIEDGMILKVKNSGDFFTEPREFDMKGENRQEDRLVQFFPYELRGHDFSFKIERAVADNEAGKNMSFLKLITGLDQFLAAKGAPIPAGALIDAIEIIGQKIGVEGVDSLAKELRNSAAQQPVPQIGAPGGPPPSQGTPGASPAAPPPTEGIDVALA